MSHTSPTIHNPHSRTNFSPIFTTSTSNKHFNPFITPEYRKISETDPYKAEPSHPQGQVTTLDPHLGVLDTVEDSMYRIETGDSRPGESPAFSNKVTKSLKIKQKNEKNYRELNKSLANLALKRLIGTSPLETEGSGSAHHVKSNSVFGQEKAQSYYLKPDFSTEDKQKFNRTFGYSLDLRGKSINNTIKHSKGKDTQLNSFSDLRERSTKPHEYDSTFSVDIVPSRKYSLFTDSKYLFSQNKDYTSKEDKPKSSSHSINFDKENVGNLAESFCLEKRVLHFDSGRESRNEPHPSQKGNKSGEFILIEQNALNQMKSGRKLSFNNLKHNVHTHTQSSSGRLDQKKVSSDVRYHEGGLGFCRTVESCEGTEEDYDYEENRDEVDDLSATLREFNHSKVSLKNKNDGASKKAAIESWKYDLTQIREDIEQRKMSYRQVDSFVEKHFEGQQPILRKPVNDKKHSSTSKTKKPNYFSFGPGEKNNNNKVRRKSLQIFDPIPVAKRLSRERDEKAFRDFMFQNTKASNCLGTTGTCEDLNSECEVKERKERKSIFKPSSQYPNLTEASKSEPHGFKPQNRAQCCDFNDICNIF